MNTMRSQNEHSPSNDRSSNRELRLLSEVDRTPEANQRDLSQRVGIALGVTNVLLKSLAQKGYVRITHAGWKRWLYALTPEGFTRKIQLTVGFVRRTLDDYQQVRQTLREELRPFALNEESRVAMCGTGSFAELVYMALKETGIEEIDCFCLGPLGRGQVLGNASAPNKCIATPRIRPSNSRLTKNKRMAATTERSTRVSPWKT